MFSNLIESAPGTHRPMAQGVLSLILHLAVGVGAVEASRRVATVITDGPRIDTTIYVVQPAPARPVVPDPDPAGAAESPVAAPVDPAVFAAPTTVPIGIPPVEPGPAIDPGRFVAAVPSGRCALCVQTDSGLGAVYSEASVDLPATVEWQPAPRYPSVLRAAGLGGRVVLQFVVDTSGRVEPASVTVLEVVHLAFGASAEEAVLRTRFRPARVRGQPVRQLVRQGVTFRIE